MMEKIKTLTKDKKVVCAGVLAIIVIIGIIFCVLTQNNSNETTKISSISPSRLETIVEDEQNLYVVMGESSASTTSLLLEAMMEHGYLVSDTIYYLDTSTYTAAFSNQEDSEDSSVQEAVSTYVSFLNKYQVDSLPTVIQFKDGKINSTSGKYIDDAYSLGTTESEERQALYEDANNGLVAWLRSVR